MKNIHIYIISWAGQHENALKIAKTLESNNYKISIVYSDPINELSIFDDIDSIKRPNDLFWADKFQACLKTFDSDIMMVIHADCFYEDWNRLASICDNTMSSFQDIGVWSPLIDNTYFQIDKTRIGKISNEPPLTVVAQTDGIIFALDKSIANRMKSVNYSGNIYGWGIEWIFVSYSYSVNKLVVIDDSIHVNHSNDRGYPSEAAYNQMNVFLNQLGTFEKIQYVLLNSYVNGKS